VLIRSQFTESDYTDLRAMPLEEQPAFSPLGYYKTDALCVPLTVSVSPLVEQHLIRFAGDEGARHKRFLAVSFTDPKPLTPMLEAIERATGARRTRLVGDFDGVQVYEYTRQ